MHPRKAAWRLVFLTYPCPTCGAAPGEKCVTSGGKPAREYTHAARGQQGTRCHNCRALLGYDAEPGDLCGRCSLVRSLEIERATKWQRRRDL